MSVRSELVREQFSAEYDGQLELLKEFLIEQILGELEDRNLSTLNERNTEIVERHVEALLEEIADFNRDVAVDEQVNELGYLEDE